MQPADAVAGTRRAGTALGRASWQRAEPERRSGGRRGEAIEIELRGWDLARADEAAAEIRRRMETVLGITDARVRRREGQPEERWTLDRRRIAQLGLSAREVGRTLLACVAGVEAGRFREAGDEFPITVRLRPQDRFSSDDLSGISLRTPASSGWGRSTR